MKSVWAPALLTVNIQEPVFTSTITLSTLSTYTLDIRLLSSCVDIRIV